MKVATLPGMIGTSGVFTDGDWVESKDQDINGEVRLIQLADVGVGTFIDKSARFLTLKKAKELRCTLLEPGDVLIARMPDPIGRACIFPDIGRPAATVVDVCVFRPDPNQVDANYVCWMVNSPDFLAEVARHAKGSTRSRISRGNLSLLEIPLPPLEEQKRIAAILDQADALRRLRRRALDRLNTLGQAIFHEMFGDVSRQINLAEIATINPKRRFEPSDEFLVTFLPMASVGEDGQVVEEKTKSLSEVRKGFTYFERGDILVAKITPCFENGKGGDTRGISYDVGFGSTEFHVIRPISEDAVDFIHLIVQSSRFRSEGEKSMTGSAGQKRVPANFIRDYSVPEVSSGDLKSLRARLESLAPILIETRSSIKMAESLFASLQHRAFQGEL